MSPRLITAAKLSAFSTPGSAYENVADLVAHANQRGAEFLGISPRKLRSRVSRRM